MSSSHLWVLLHVGEIVAVCPSAIGRIESVEIVEALGVRPRSSKKIKFLSNSAERHTCSRGRALTLDLYLAPKLHFQIKCEKVVQTLGSVPTSKNKQAVAYDTRAMVCSRRRGEPIWHHFGPLHLVCIQLVQVVKIIPTVTSPENVY
jgi:hypothetical protein